MAAESGGESAGGEQAVTGRLDDRQVVSARRRLLGGAVAAPAVLALHSGSALAASSLTCVDKQNKSPASPPQSESLDQWVRVELWCLKPSENASPDTCKWFVRGKDIETVALTTAGVGAYFLRTGQWLEFDLQSETAGEVLFEEPHVGDGPNKRVPVAGGKYVALRFRPFSGQVDIVGVVGSTSEGTAVSATCWTSVANMA